MSKSRGNVVAPWEVLDRFGADAFRWYFFTSKQPWDGYRFSVDAVGEGVRAVPAPALERLRASTCSTRTPATSARRRADRSRPLALSRLAATVETVRERLDDYDATTRGRRDRRVRRGPLELVRAPLAAALLGRRRAPRSRRCASSLVTRRAAARAVHAVRRRRDLRQPRRRARERAPVRLPRAGRARRGARVRDGDGAPDGGARPRRAQPGRRSRCASRCARR